MLNLFPLMRYRRWAKLNYTKEILANASTALFFFFFLSPLPPCSMWCLSLIYNFIWFHLLPKLTGHNGTINGQGQSWWKKYRQKRLNHTRGPLVQIMFSSDIVITNITLRDSPFWTIHPYDCKNITIKGVTILAPVFGAPNTDGIDPGKYLLLNTKIYFIS